MEESPGNSNLDEDDSRRFCAVCGARALGYNFGVLSCESCKAFFRRNGNKDESQVQCPFNNVCNINEKSRRFCQACRLEKCFAVGMSREWGAHGEPTVRRNGARRMAVEPRPPQHIDEPLEKKFSVKHDELENSNSRAIDCRSVPNGGMPFPSSASTTPGSSDNVTLPKEIFLQLMEQAKNPSPSCTCRCSCGFYPHGTQLTAKSPGMHQRFMQPPNEHNYNNSIPYGMESAMMMSMSPSNNHMLGMSPWGPPPLDPVAMPSTPGGGYPGDPQQSSYNSHMMGRHGQHPVPPNPHCSMEGKNPSVYKKMTFADRSMLIELLTANETMKAPIDGMYAKVEYSLMDAVKCVDVAVRRMIMMAKTLQSFTRLTNKDQMALIKGGSIEMLIIRGAMVYDPKKQSWMHSVEAATSNSEAQPLQMKLDILKGSFQGSEHFLAHLQFLTAFDDRIRTNEMMMTVITAMVLFDPGRDGVNDKAAVAATREKYCDLLLRIFECEFSKERAQEMHGRIENMLKELRVLNTSLIEVVYGLDQSQIDPLLLEVFGLRNTTKD